MAFEGKGGRSVCAVESTNDVHARSLECKPACIPPPWGKPLTESDYANLSTSWISREIADAAMLRRVSDLEGREIIGQKGKRDCTGILITYYWPGDPAAFNHRLRRDKPDWTQGKNGKPKQERKYLSPPNGANRVYVPPGVTLDQLADKQIPIVLAEGEKKALALWRLANHETNSPRFIPIAIAGVWNWLGRIGKTGGPYGERLDVRGPIPDLSRIEWNERKVFIVFDANVHTNDSVKWARKGICRELTRRSAKVDFVNLPEGGGVNGIDDLLVAWGPAKVLELFEQSVSGGRLRVIVPPQFESRPEGLFRVTTKGAGLTQVQLTNFQARIVTSVRLDDGVESKREFEIEAELMGKRCRFTVPASEFAAMNWPIDRLGSAAKTFPHLREYARTAIQTASLTSEDRCVYTHTGWRRIENGWVYLHAGGGVGESGARTDVDVRLIGALSRYQLLPSTGTGDLAEAVSASLRLLDLSPHSISFPLLAAVFRAVLGDADFALHVVGETGTFKSELAGLHQQHFGAALDRVHLPGSWSSTGNVLEALAFHAKDALLVIDDFAPQGSGTDVARYHASAERVFRAAGNQAGRSRLDSTARLREPKPPRALILSTGEDTPRGQSVRARMIIVELSKGCIDLGRLTACQADAQKGLYARAMAGLVQWVAGHHDPVRAEFQRKVSEYRGKALRNSAHARTPDIIANLQAGFELFLEFAVYSSAIDQRCGDRLASRCWDALCRIATDQAKHQKETEPTTRFLTLLSSVLTSGRAHLEARNGGVPDRTPSSCGWRCDAQGNCAQLGDRIGWVDDDNVYLEPTAAFRVVQTAAGTRAKSSPYQKVSCGSDFTKNICLRRLMRSGRPLQSAALLAARQNLYCILCERLFCPRFLTETRTRTSGKCRVICRVSCRELSLPDISQRSGINWMHLNCRVCRVFREE